MKKQFLKSALIAVAGVGLMAGSAMALPNLAEIAVGTIYQAEWSAYSSYTDTGAEWVYLTDTDGFNDSSTSALKFALGDFTTNSLLTFGIFDILADNSKVYLPLFNTNTPFAAATVNFNLVAGTASFGANTAQIDNVFGFYLYKSDSQQYIHSVSAFNNGSNQTLIYNTDTIGSNSLAQAAVVVAFEDILGGGDNDFNDVVVGVSDVAPVPEPTTMLLFGTGLLGLAGAARRRKNS